MLLRLEDVAVRLGMSYNQIRALVVQGTIPSIKVSSRSIRVEEAELNKYIAKMKEESRVQGLHGRDEGKV